MGGVPREGRDRVFSESPEAIFATGRGFIDTCVPSTENGNDAPSSFRNLVSKVAVLLVSAIVAVRDINGGVVLCDDSKRSSNML